MVDSTSDGLPRPPRGRLKRYAIITFKFADAILVPAMFLCGAYDFPHEFLARFYPLRWLLLVPTAVYVWRSWPAISEWFARIRVSERLRKERDAKRQNVLYEDSTPRGRLKYYAIRAFYLARSPLVPAMFLCAVFDFPHEFLARFYPLRWVLLAAAFVDQWWREPAASEIDAELRKEREGSR